MTIFNFFSTANDQANALTLSTGFFHTVMNGNKGGFYVLNTGIKIN